MKKIFKVLVSIAMFCTVILPLDFINVKAEESITDETSLVNAINSATQGNETVITLDCNISVKETIQIAADKNIVLDLNSFTLLIDDAGKDVIDNKGTLTIKNGMVAALDDGKNTQKNAVTNEEKAVLNVQQDEGFTTKLIGRSGINNYGVVNVYNGVVESYNRNAIWGSPTSELTIYDGKITSPNGSSGYGRAISTEGNVTIYGGTFYAGGSSGAGDNYMNAIGMFNGAVLTIDPAEGKTVSVVSETDYAVSTWGDAKVIIKGGTFACNGSRDDIMDFSSGNVQIYGGTFKHRLNKDYLAPSCIFEEEENGYVVKKANDIVDVTVHSVEELQTALNGPITEPKSIELAKDLVIPENMDLTLKDGYDINVPNDTTLTVNGILRLNGTIKNEGTLAVGDNGFIEYPLNLVNNGTIDGLPVVENGVYKVATPMQLQWLTYIVAMANTYSTESVMPSYIQLTKDITLPDVNFTSIGDNELHYYCYSTFDGNNHKIINLNVDVTQAYRGGLFGYIGDVTIKNLTISGTSTNSTSAYIGALAGIAQGTCTISNVHVEDYTVYSPISYGVGGFFGQISNEKGQSIDFINCSLDATVTGYANVGGFWGTSTGSQGKIGIYNSTLSGEVNAINVNGAACGGYGDSATVQIIGLNHTNLKTIVKNQEVNSIVSASSNSNLDTNYLDSTKYQAAKDENGEWTTVVPGTKVEATINEAPYTSLENAVAAAKTGDVIVLNDNVELDKMLELSTEGITLDLNQHTITSSDQFDNSFLNGSHVMNITGKGITVKNGTIEATSKNKHVLNVYGADNFTLEDVVLDHSNSLLGAPLVVTGSTTTLKGSVELVTGKDSWYAMNIDNTVNGSAKASTVNFAENAQIKLSGESRNGIKVDNSKEEKITIDFAENVKFVTEENADWKILYFADHAQADVIDPENAGLTIGSDGYVHVHQYGDPEFIWSDDYAKATATFTCEYDGNIVEMQANVTKTKTEPTQEKAGSITYVATVVFEGKTYTDTKTVSVEKLPVIILGANSTWQLGSEKGLTITSDAAYKNFVKVTMDGKDVDKANYTVAQGSTIVTLNAAYLNTLTAGTHEVAIVSTTGTATTKLTITKAAGTETTPQNKPGTTTTETTTDKEETVDTGVFNATSIMAMWTLVGFGVVVMLAYKKKRI